MSECQLMEQIDYSMLFRWFVGFSMDDQFEKQAGPAQEGVY
jgi:transposase